jgi:hypothetical protein
VFFGFIGLVVWDQTRKRSLVQLEVLKKKQTTESRWKTLLAEIESAGTAKLPELLERAKDELYRSLDEAFSISSRAFPIRDLAKSLTETHGVTNEKVNTLTSFLEFTEMVRFSNGAAFGTASDAVRISCERVDAIRRICLDLPRNPLEKPS